MAEGYALPGPFQENAAIADPSRTKPNGIFADRHERITKKKIT
jgi:hypothetical protein